MKNVCIWSFLEICHWLLQLIWCRTLSCTINFIFQMWWTVWVKIDAAESASIKATLTIENTTDNCIGSVSEKRGCWSFLKGGFVSRRNDENNYWKYNRIRLYQSSDAQDIDIQVTSASLQPFSEEQWRFNQQYQINTVSSEIRVEISVKKSFICISGPIFCRISEIGSSTVMQLLHI